MSSLSSASLNATATNISVGGLISGLNTDSIVTGLLAIEQQKLTKIDTAKARVQSVQTAFKGIQGRLLALQTSLTNLSRSQNGAFDARSAKSSDEAIVTAAASASAATGIYSFRVNSLAQAHQIASQGFDSATSAVTQGTLQISVGDSQTATITIDSSNATAQGLVDAINAAGLDASAALVNDGSAAQGFRILLTAKNQGTAGKIAIVNNLAASSGSATKPTFDTASFSTAIKGAGFSGASTPTVAGTYTGASNNTFSFEVLSGGTVGTDNGIQLSYKDKTGTKTGTITLNAADVGVAKTVVDGLQVQFDSGSLVAGNTFQVKAFVPTVQAAQDAQVTLGSGDGALTVASSSNVVNNVIPGVTLNLQNADPNKVVAVTLANDTEAAKKAVESFVNAYNDVISFIDSQISYDSKTQTGGPLLGNRAAISLQDQVRSVVSNVVAGANPRMNRLSALGITTNDKGSLTVNQAKLADVLGGKVTGVSFADVKRLFALTASTSASQVQFVTASTKTKATGAAVQVRVTQAAESGAISAGNALAASVVINGTNGSLGLTLDGRASTLTLAPGTYSRNELATLLQAAIGSNADYLGRKATVSVNGDKLTVVSNSVGSTSGVILTGGSAASALGFAGNEADSGQDVAGWYVADGNIESATGSGQFLVGSGGNAITADLQVRIAATTAQIGAGLDATVTPTRGFASRLDQVLTTLFDSVDGRLKTIEDGFDASIAQLDAQKAKQTQIMQTRRDALLRQFRAMETTLAKLQGATGFLNQQSNSNKT
ncbi:MAG: flagellar filament capping protein FliD [Gemmataceae bacterium]|nr:flagellar filament capping protein FliD [Gemmataceae bacterium]